MRKLAVGAMVVAAMICASTRAADEIKAPELSGKLGMPIEIFNGKDLTGWSWVQFPNKKNPDAPKLKMEEVWTVKDGVLHSAGKPTGYLAFEKPFTKFVLTVEERHIAKGNGGLLVGITEKQWKSNWPGLEIQTMTDNAGDLWNHNSMKMTGDPKRTQKNGQYIQKAGNSQKPVGEWETMEVIVDGTNLTFKVNGVVQNVVTDTENLAGQVGLQAEGAEMEFRKITVTPIE